MWVKFDSTTASFDMKCWRTGQSKRNFGVKFVAFLKFSQQFQVNNKNSEK